MLPTRYPPLRFTCSAAIGHWSSSCHNTYHQAINVSTTEAKLFAIRCGINQAISILHIKHIVVITNSLHAIMKIFDSSSHPYQIHSTAIARELREFFNKYTNNYIKFWDCHSTENW